MRCVPRHLVRRLVVLDRVRCLGTGLLAAMLLILTTASDPLHGTPPGRRLLASHQVSADLAQLLNLLRITGGPDWEYRSLLETHLSVNAHFRGTGITQNTLSPDDGRRGVPEFVGPNLALTELAEWAVLDFGHLEFEEVHDAPSREPSTGQAPRDP